MASPVDECVECCDALECRDVPYYDELCPGCECTYRIEECMLDVMLDVEEDEFEDEEDLLWIDPEDEEEELEYLDPCDWYEDC